MHWNIPPSPWVLHSTPVLGKLTEGWINIQTTAVERYDSRLLGLYVAPDQPPTPRWLVASDRRDLALAYRGRFKTGGLSPVWLATQFRDGRRPDVVHAHWGPTASQLRHFARAVRAPLVASFYGYDASREDYKTKPVWKRRYRRLFAAAAACVVEGPHMGSRLVSLGCPEEKVNVVRLPADADGLEGVEEPKAPGFRVVMAGRFVEKKGFDTGIRAFARALGDHPDAELLMLGGGDLEGDHRRLVAELGIEDRVRWPGRMPFQQFMREIAASHVGLYPSRTARDGDSEGGAPVTLIEAQWLGVPAVVSTHDDLPFVASPDAIKLDPVAVDDWADVLRTLYDDRSRLAALSASARAFAREHHSPLANARGRERVYDQARAAA